MSKKFVLLTGLDWMTGDGPVRAEAGEVRDDIPKRSVSWLEEQGLIVEFDPKKHVLIEGTGLVDLTPADEPSGDAAEADTGTGATEGAESQENTTETGGENAGGEG